LSGVEGRKPAPVIFGLAGPELTPEERAFFTSVRPFGFILFARNCETPEQISALTADLRKMTGRAFTPILIDEEGGRVARLRTPLFPEFPPARYFGELATHNREDARRATFENARDIGMLLLKLGINVNCAPVLDIPIPGGHEVIGDRAFGGDPGIVADLGAAACEGYLAAGIVPIIKHIPGHGRAMVDSHTQLPRVTENRLVLEVVDFSPFRHVSRRPWSAHVWAMTAHVLYTAIDPQNPATMSQEIIRHVIREDIGFTGPLIADDLSMGALGGPIGQRAVRALGAGVDVALHCNGKMEEMQEIAGALPPMRLDSLARLHSMALT